MKRAFLVILLVFLSIMFLNQTAFCQSKTGKSLSVWDLVIKSEVETAISMLRAISEKHQKGEMTMEQAKKLGADLLRELRYGADGYFWADTEEGVNVILYGRKDVEGRNRLEDKDQKGNFYVKEFIGKAKTGGGYVEYWFSKRGESTAQPKRSYVLPFKPFGWVVGTGYYR
jgi:methyl-accepting chemotaxis protein